MTAMIGSFLSGVAPGILFMYIIRIFIMANARDSLTRHAIVLIIGVVGAVITMNICGQMLISMTGAIPLAIRLRFSFFLGIASGMLVPGIVCMITGVANQGSRNDKSS